MMALNPPGACTLHRVYLGMICVFLGGKGGCKLKDP